MNLIFHFLFFIIKQSRNLPTGQGRLRVAVFESVFDQEYKMENEDGVDPSRWSRQCYCRFSGTKPSWITFSVLQRMKLSAWMRIHFSFYPWDITTMVALPLDQEEQEQLIQKNVWSYQGDIIESIRCRSIRESICLRKVSSQELYSPPVKWPGLMIIYTCLLPTLLLTDTNPNDEAVLGNINHRRKTN